MEANKSSSDALAQQPLPSADEIAEAEKMLAELQTKGRVTEKSSGAEPGHSSAGFQLFAGSNRKNTLLIAVFIVTAAVTFWIYWPRGGPSRASNPLPPPGTLDASGIPQP